MTKQNHYKEKVQWIIQLLKERQISGYSGVCWGFNFDWQNSDYLFPLGTPTIVNTAFVADAFLDAYDVFKESEYLEIARSACDFLLNDLHITHKDGQICFSYTPLDNSRVYNASALGARLLARTYAQTREPHLKEQAHRAIYYLLNNQKPSGSWRYGEHKLENYIDNFHTGFVLESITDYINYTGDEAALPHLKRGLDYYVHHLFLEDGTPKYYPIKVHPIDTHNIQALVTLVKASFASDYLGLMKRISLWLIRHMQDKEGYFYYRKGYLVTNKIPYIRWTQAWAFHGLTTYYQYLVQRAKESDNGD
jgi:rhamnogalacturonyl hydrolase YesR